jgi:hypothetical protein
MGLSPPGVHPGRALFLSASGHKSPVYGRNRTELAQVAKQLLSARSKIAQVDQAHQIIRSEPLVAKIAGMAREIAEQVRTETGVAPAYTKVGIQMPDDSVFEVRVGFCPDGCGQMNIIPAVLPL